MRCKDHLFNWTWSLHSASVLQLPTELIHSLCNKINWYSHTEVVQIAGKNSLYTSVNHFAIVWQNPRQHPPNQTALNFWMKFCLEKSTDIFWTVAPKGWAGYGTQGTMCWKGAKVLAKTRPFQKMVTFQAVLRRSCFLRDSSWAAKQ